MESPRCVPVDDANGNVLTGIVFFNPEKVPEGEAHIVWIFPNKTSGFDLNPLSSPVGRELKKQSNGHWVA